MTGSSSSTARRFAVALAALAAVAATSVAANADEPKCPPGSWFCADAEIKVGVPGTPPAGAGGAVVVAPPPANNPPPVIIYTPAPPPAPIYAPPPVAYYPPPPPPPPPARHRSEVGLNFRLVGAAYSASDTYKGDVGAAGIGASLRFRPTPRFALDIGIDVLGGTDANGYKRSETPLSLLGLLYLNPKSKAQVYLLGGFGFSSARVETRDATTQITQAERYTYFGAMFGGGLEFRVARKVALNFDIRGFVRGRTDDGADKKPEFTAKDGRTTNSSGGALFTGGLTFYF